MFSHTWRVWPSMSPMPAMLPSGRRAVMPETNTSRPFASIAIACEKCAVGCGARSVRICCLGMRLGYTERAWRRMKPR